MSIVDEYARQYGWRSWPAIHAEVPLVEGQLVLDLGCGIGDQAKDLSDRGAHVIGIDGNQDLIRFAKSRDLKDVRFRVGDISSLSEIDETVDGIWSSFLAGYFPNDFSQILECWYAKLRPGGWIVLTEVDDLFGHQPLSPHVQSLFSGYVNDAMTKSRYDFCMGHKLADHLTEAGFSVKRSLDVDDKELSFAGPASTEVTNAWKKRLGRMTLLRDFCGDDFELLCDEFIHCLKRDNHQCSAKIYCCIATK